MTVLYSPRSLYDLESVRQYIIGETGDRGTADRFLRSLLNECDSLAILPERHPPYPYAPKWRMMPFGSYLIFYAVREQEVRVGHIRHASRRPFRG